MSFGVNSMTDPLRRVALHRPGPSLLQADAAQWHYGVNYDPARVADEHAAFAELVAASGAEVLWLDDDDRGNADAVFTYDASLMTAAGAILMNPGKPLRRGEQLYHRDFYRQQAIPVLGQVDGAGSSEAGDTLWLDAGTLAVGRGFRTNQAGIDQLAELLQAQAVEVVGFDLPVFYGADACLHLMSLLSFVDHRTAAVMLPLLPVGLYQALVERDFRLVELPPDEYEASLTLSGNILATAPGQCIMIDGFPQTRAALEAAGIEVAVFEGRALCMGCEGGPTCLTRPILRSTA